MALILTDQGLDRAHGYLVGTVHDEVIVHARHEHVEAVKALVSAIPGRHLLRRLWQ